VTEAFGYDLNMDDLEMGSRAMAEDGWADALRRHDVSPDSPVEVLRGNAITRDMTIEISQIESG
jgi:hypothetical protein